MLDKFCANFKQSWHLLDQLIKCKKDSGFKHKNEKRVRSHYTGFMLGSPWNCKNGQNHFHTLKAQSIPTLSHWVHDTWQLFHEIKWVSPTRVVTENLENGDKSKRV